MAGRWRVGWAGAFCGEAHRCCRRRWRCLRTCLPGLAWLLPGAGPHPRAQHTAFAILHSALTQWLPVYRPGGTSDIQLTAKGNGSCRLLLARHV